MQVGPARTRRGGADCRRVWETGRDRANRVRAALVKGRVPVVPVGTAFRRISEAAADRVDRARRANRGRVVAQVAGMASERAFRAAGDSPVRRKAVCDRVSREQARRARAHQAVTVRVVGAESRGRVADRLRERLVRLREQPRNRRRPGLQRRLRPRPRKKNESDAGDAS